MPWLQDRKSTKKSKGTSMTKGRGVGVVISSGERKARDRKWAHGDLPGVYFLI